MSLPSAAIFGSVALLPGEPPVVCRDTAAARWWARPASRWLARREARALQALAGDEAFPALLRWDGRRLLRSAIPGATMRETRPRDPGYFRQALRVLSRMHHRGVAHNDLAREPNWLVTPEGAPALIDFQLAWCDARARPHVPADGAGGPAAPPEAQAALLPATADRTPARAARAHPRWPHALWRVTVHPPAAAFRRWLGAR